MTPATHEIRKRCQRMARALRGRVWHGVVAWHVEMLGRPTVHGATLPALERKLRAACERRIAALRKAMEGP